MISSLFLRNSFFIILPILTSNAWGSAEILECPPESTKIEYSSPVTHRKVQICGYEKEGKTVKHGYEYVYDSKGAIERKKYYVHGKESEHLPEVSKSSGGDHTAPGNAEPSKEITEKANQSVAAIKEMLKVLVFQGRSAGEGEFRIDKCETNLMGWVQSAMTKTPLTRTYIFKEGCDVSGSFTAMIGGEKFPVNFDLRKLKKFNKVEMMVSMEVARGTRYVFIAHKGKLSSPFTISEFTANYEVTITPIPLNVDMSSQKGEIQINKVDGQEVNIKHPLIYHGRPITN